MAASKVRIDVLGLPQLLRSLRNFDDKAQKRISRAGVSAAARILVKEMRVRAPRDSGLLKKALGSRQRQYQKVVMSIIGSRVGFKQMVLRTKGKIAGDRKQVFRAVSSQIADPVKYAHLLEFGTEPHAIRMAKGRVIQHPGSPPQPFMRTARDAKRSEMELVMRQKMTEALQREALKAKGAK